MDLSEVKGLDKVHHMTPSEISLSTLTASRFKLSPAFLRRAGVSRGLIEDLANGQRFARQYETCFLSYSSKDVSFAEKLYQSLEDAGVRVFWDVIRGRGRGGLQRDDRDPRNAYIDWKTGGS